MPFPIAPVAAIAAPAIGKLLGGLIGGQTKQPDRMKIYDESLKKFLASLPQFDTAGLQAQAGLDENKATRLRMQSFFDQLKRGGMSRSVGQASAPGAFKLQGLRELMANRTKIGAAGAEFKLGRTQLAGQMAGTRAGLAPTQYPGAFRQAAGGAVAGAGEAVGEHFGLQNLIDILRKNPDIFNPKG